MHQSTLPFLGLAFLTDILYNVILESSYKVGQTEASAKYKNLYNNRTLKIQNIYRSSN